MQRTANVSSWVWGTGEKETQRIIRRQAEQRGIPGNWLEDVARAIARLDGRSTPSSRDLAEAMQYFPPDEWRRLAASDAKGAARARQVLEEYQRREQLRLWNPNYFVQSARDAGREFAREFSSPPSQEYILYKLERWLRDAEFTPYWNNLSERERAGWRRQWASAFRAGWRAERKRLEQPSLFNPAKLETPWGPAYAVRDGRAVVFQGPVTYEGRRHWTMYLTGIAPEGWMDPDFQLEETHKGSNLYQLWYRFYTGEAGDWLRKSAVLTPALPLRQAKERAAQWVLDRITDWAALRELQRQILEAQRIRNPLPEVTDRALRYRARNAIAQPERRCIYCGTTQGWIEVDHINGFEEDNTPENLAWACRACNSAKGAWFARVGIGRRTRQFNPKRRRSATARGARTLGEWVDAVMALKGLPSTLTLDQAIERVRATPPEDRSTFAREIWERRRERGTDRRVPF
ncbi:MAG: HNH endonuclease [Anaerolineae bacterium]|nr:HNH endonuclease [Anaerolineae bacterium]